jgi:hypothetical protein
MSGHVGTQGPLSDPRYAHLTYPLNAFACASELEFGRVDYLHYGLFDATHVDLAAAQARSTSLLLEQLPSPCAMLEIGIGFGTTASVLHEAGFSVTGVSPDPVQVAIARERAGAAAVFEISLFEDWNPEESGLGLIVSQESAQYIAPATLFGKSAAHMAAGGRLVILDQVRWRDVGGGAAGPHLDGVLRREAEANGFRLKAHADLSADAAPTFDYLLAALTTHQADVEAMIGLGAGGLDTLIDAVTANRRRHRDGETGYAMYAFDR